MPDGKVGLKHRKVGHKCGRVRRKCGSSTSPGLWPGKRRVWLAAAEWNTLDTAWRTVTVASRRPPAEPADCSVTWTMFGPGASGGRDGGLCEPTGYFAGEDRNWRSPCSPCSR